MVTSCGQNVNMMCDLLELTEVESGTLQLKCSHFRPRLDRDIVNTQTHAHKGNNA